MTLVDTVREDLDERVEIERLENRAADRVGRDLVDAPLARGGKDDDVRAMLGETFPDLLDELVPVEAGHHQVEEDQIDMAIALELVEPDRPILRQLDAEFHPPQDSLKKNADGQIVVDDEDASSRAVEFVHGGLCDAASHVHLSKSYTDLMREACLQGTAQTAIEQ